jgi:hypothetical protein
MTVSEVPAAITVVSSLLSVSIADGETRVSQLSHARRIAAEKKAAAFCA